MDRIISVLSSHLLQMGKDPVVAQGEVWAIWRVWHLRDVEVPEEVLHWICSMCWCVIMEESPGSAKFWPPPAHSLLQICEYFQVQTRIDTSSLGYPLPEDKSTVIKKKGSACIKFGS